MNLEPKFISLIKNIISKHLPQAEIFIFGSRTTKTNQEFSDVDIAIKCDELTFSSLALIKFDLEESDLPYKVDVANYHDLDEKILKNLIKI
jgi:predicted nucleotidyltransferase